MKRKHKASIIQDASDWSRCYICMMQGDYSQKGNLQTHHVYGGYAGRKRSEAEGLTVRLCERHHAHGGPDDVHINASLSRILKEEGQRAFEKTHTRQEFIDLIHRNYLSDESKETEKEGIIWLHIEAERLPWDQ